MTALVREKLTATKGELPRSGAYDIAANKRIFKGAIVCGDSAGRAIPGTTLAGGAVRALGKASATVNNLTGLELGGSADAAKVLVEYGVFGFENSAGGDEISSDDIGKACYVVDDQTVALTSNSGARVVAGFIVDVRDGKVWVWMGPGVGPAAQASALALASLPVQKRTVTVLHSDLTNDVDNTSSTVNIGAALPANARIVGVDFHTYTPFTGGGLTAVTIDVGTSGDVDALIDGADAFAAAVDGGLATIPKGIRPNKLFASAGAQLIATFAPDASHDLEDATAGAVTIDVMFVELG